MSSEIGNSSFKPYGKNQEDEHYTKQLEIYNHIMKTDPVILKLKSQKRGDFGMLYSSSDINRKILERAYKVFQEYTKDKEGTFETAHVAQDVLYKTKLKEGGLADPANLSPRQKIQREKNVKKAASLFISKLKKPRAFPEKQKFELSPEEEHIARAQKVLNLKRQDEFDKATEEGDKIRDAVVLPSQIVESLQSHFEDAIPKDQLAALAKVICREVNEMTLHPDKYQGKSRHLKAKESPQRFPVFMKDSPPTTETLHLDYDCWLEMLPDGKDFRVFIFDSSSKGLLGSGTYKEVFKGNDIEFVLKTAASLREKSGRKRAISSRQTSIEEEVFVRPRTSDKDTLKEQQDRAKNILSGIQIQQLISDKVKQLGKKVNLAALPSRRLGADSDLVELRQKKYNGDLLEAIRQHSLSLGVSKSKKYPMGKPELLKVLIDSSEACQAMHLAGLVHRDIKPANLLVKIDTDKHVHGYVSDFDLTGVVGKDFSSEYDFWDQASVKGLVTPFSDCYGLAMSLGEVYFGAVFGNFRGDPKQIYNGSSSKSPLRAAALDFILNEEMAKIAEGFKEPLKKLLLAIKDKDPGIRINKVKEFCKKHESSLSPSAKSVFSNLDKTLKATEMVCNLIIKSVENSQKVMAYFLDLKRTNPEKYKDLTTPVPLVDIDKNLELLAKKRAIIKECSESCGGYSMAQVQEELEAIQKLIA